MSATTLDDLLRAIHNAILKAQQLTEQQHMRQLRNYFDDDDRAIVRDIKVPSNHPDANPGDYMILKVPLMSLIPPSAIKIKSLTVKLKLVLRGFMDNKPTKKGFKATESYEEAHRGPLEIDLGGSSGSLFPSKNKNLADIKIEFEAGDPSESFLRINDQLIKSIVAEYPDNQTSKPKAPNK